MDSQIYPQPRRWIPRHARPERRHASQGTFLTVLLGTVVLGALSIGSVAGIAPGSGGPAPSFVPASVSAVDSRIATASSGRRASARIADQAAKGTATGHVPPSRTAPATCPATPPPEVPLGPGRPGSDMKFPPSAAPLPGRTAVFLGDSYTSGYVGAGVGADGWPAIVSSSLGWRSANLAVPGTGFVNPGWTGQPIRTFLDDTIRLAPRFVVVAAGHNDRRYGAARAASAADDAIDRLRTGHPNAILVIVGPIWHDGSPAASIVGLRDHLLEKAAAVGAVFIDPLAGRWFAGSNHAYIGSDGIHPTSAGHRHIASLVLAALRSDARFAPSPARVAAAPPTEAPPSAAWAPASRSLIVTTCPS